MKVKNRFLYKIKSRNLILGVYSESDDGFLGIRKKFDSRYVFTEYLKQTAFPEEEIEKCPDELILVEGFKGRCWYCGEPTKFDKRKEPRWFHIGDNPYNCKNVLSNRPPNRALFNYLEGKEKELFS